MVWWLYWHYYTHIVGLQCVCTKIHISYISCWIFKINTSTDFPNLGAIVININRMSKKLHCYCSLSVHPFVCLCVCANIYIFPIFQTISINNVSSDFPCWIQTMKNSCIANRKQKTNHVKKILLWCLYAHYYIYIVVWECVCANINLFYIFDWFLKQTFLKTSQKFVHKENCYITNILLNNYKIKETS